MLGNALPSPAQWDLSYHAGNKTGQHMSYAEQLAEREAPGLMESAESDLYVGLAQAAKSLEEAPQEVQTGHLDLRIYLPVVSEEEKTKLMILGKKLFRRIHRETYELICESGEVPVEVTDNVKESFGIRNGESLTAALTSILVPYLGMAAPTAVLVAALISRRLIKAVHETLCEAWLASLSSSPFHPR